MKRSILVVVLVLVAALAAGAWLVASRARAPERSTAESTGDKKSEHHGSETLTLTEDQRRALGIKVESVAARAPEVRLDVTGTIAANPDRSVVTAPRTPGRVVRVFARLGDTVEAGAPLALLDSVEAADAFGELAQSESAVAVAQARADQERQLYAAKVRVIEAARQQTTAEGALRELEQVELGRPKQEYVSALAKLELAQAEHERERLLVEKKIGARKDLVRAEKELVAARSELAAVAETVQLTARQDLLQANEALKQARAQRDRIRNKLHLLGFSDATLADALRNPGGRPAPAALVAPFRGTVIDRQVTEGQLLDPASTPFRLADLSTVWALLDVPETELAWVRPGQEVVVETGGDQKMAHTGRVVYVGDVVSDQTRTLKVRVEIPNPQRHFKPGMFVSARIAARQPGPAVLMVPKAAVVHLDQGPVVFVDGDGGLRPRPVETGPELGGWITIRKGLTAGDRVVTEGAFALKAQIVKAKLGEE